MKRTRLFFLLIAFLAFQPTGFAQQLIQGFEGNYFPPAGWDLITTKGAGWVSSVNEPQNGARSAFVDFENIQNGFLGEGNSWLISPKVQSIKAGDNLSFYLKPQFSDVLDPGDGYFDSLLIYVSTTTKDLSSFTIFKKISISGLSTVYAQYQYSLGAFAGQSIYIAFRNHQMEGNGFYLDDITAGSPIPNDVGSQGINLSNDAIIASGTTINIVDTVKNFGTNALPSGIPVRYTVNNGAPITVLTATGLASGATATVSFTGANAFVPATAGKYVIKVFTDYGTDVNRANDTINYLLTVQNAVSSYPYFTDFDNDPEWTLAGQKLWQRRDHLELGAINGDLVNPVGVQDTAMLAQTFSNLGDFILRSPLLNFTAVAKPMLNFFVAVKNGGSIKGDELQVIVSTDGGLTYHATPLYKKTNQTSPRLATVPDGIAVQYVPQDSLDWRHEIVDLSTYAGIPNVIVAFKVISGNSNNVWIDNVTVVNQPVAYYYAEKVTSASQVVTGAFNTKVIFHTLPTADSIRMQGHNTEPPDNLPKEERFADNFTATSADGSVETPTFVYNRFITIAFSGNSISRAIYDVSMDITGLTGSADPDKLYILKRADQSGPWQALSTTRSGNILMAAGLDNFSDFAIGYSIVVPVNLISFTGYLDNNNTSILNWKTAQEVNIRNYEVQRMQSNSWFTLGTVASNGGALSNSYSFADNAPEVGVNYYKLKINGLDGSSSYSEIVKVALNPSGNKVYQNVPNPFKNYTIIRYDLSRKANVKIVVYNVSGSEIAVLENGQKQAGSYQAKWLTGNVPAGNYFYKVVIDDQVITKGMLKIQ